MDKGKRIVLIGSCVSLILFIMFLILQDKGALILELESRWLFVAGVPILVSLIVGGYIRKFKGLGVEIETRLKSKIGTTDLLATDALEHIEGADKGTLSFLYDTPTEELSKRERLKLVEGRRDYYNVFAFSLYLERLVNLKFLEIQDQVGRFRYLVSIRAFKSNAEIRENTINDFLNNLANRTVLPQIEEFVEFNTIKTTEKLLSILPKVRDSKLGCLPVLDDQKHLLGVVTKEAIESRIADAVLSAQEVT